VKSHAMSSSPLSLRIFILLGTLLSAAAHAQTYTNSTSGNITDNACFNRTFAVPALNVADLNVSLNITHTWRGDLRIRLSSPAVSNRILFNRHGGSADNLIVLFDDAGATSITTDTANHSLPAVTRSPNESLAVFNGNVAAGTWTMEICDLANLDLGTFNSASLIFVQAGTITIIKDTVPNNAQDFAFATTGAGLSAFSLDDDADVTLSNTRTFNNLAPGAFTVTEANATGWVLSALTCSDPDNGSTVTLAARVANIDLDAAESITCTFTNRRLQADLVLTKTNTPGINGEVDQATDTVVSGAAANYTITVVNQGPDAANGSVLTDPTPAGLSCTTASCASAGGASCPAATGAALVTALQGAGATIPTLPANGSVTIVMSCAVN
jgi:uncharacterized repeat protein (TIGR01451 family)